eukprot:gnl/TRDRNA2_/TRDRNA2_177257_c0_seq7.p1 gnl/TRDRNA2_/TRDRNA2_177257_c0~~gnl/TRDRNA2_/TRDRNA2_177257_c0_seq7.p1  ORF type:complete len:275 (-),score=34.90 gnl/TRDRNA2_/TRDRNA2_177257_c0_seq7:346-1170(-)
MGGAATSSMTQNQNLFCETAAKSQLRTSGISKYDVNADYPISKDVGLPPDSVTLELTLFGDGPLSQTRLHSATLNAANTTVSKVAEDEFHSKVPHRVIEFRAKTWSLSMTTMLPSSTEEEICSTTFHRPVNGQSGSKVVKYELDWGRWGSMHWAKLCRPFSGIDTRPRVMLTSIAGNKGGRYEVLTFKGEISSLSDAPGRVEKDVVARVQVGSMKNPAKYPMKLEIWRQDEDRNAALPVDSSLVSFLTLYMLSAEFRPLLERRPVSPTMSMQLY